MSSRCFFVLQVLSAVVWLRLRAARGCFGLFWASLLWGGLPGCAEIGAEEATASGGSLESAPVAMSPVEQEGAVPGSRLDAGQEDTSDSLPTVEGGEVGEASADLQDGTGQDPDPGPMTMAGSGEAGGGGNAGDGGPDAPPGGGAEGSLRGSCPGEEVIWTLQGDGSYLFETSGDLSGQAHALDSICVTRFDGGDSAFGLQAPVAGMLEATFTPLDDFQGVISLRASCADRLSEWTCDTNPDGVTPVSVRQELLAGELLWLTVDSYAGAGRYALSVSVAPESPRETCPGEPALWQLQADGSYLHQVQDDLTARGDHGDSRTLTCPSVTGGRDAFHDLTAPASGLLEVTVMPSSGLRPVVYLRSACASRETEFACGVAASAGATVSHALQVVGGEAVFVVVDEYIGLGDYTLSARLSP